MTAFPTEQMETYPSFPAVPDPQSVTPSLFQERKSRAYSGFSESRGLSKALDRKAQTSVRAQSQADPNSAVWEKAVKSEQRFLPTLR